MFTRAHTSKTAVSAILCSGWWRRKLQVWCKMTTSAAWQLIYLVLGSNFSHKLSKEFSKRICITTESTIVLIVRQRRATHRCTADTIERLNSFALCSHQRWYDHIRQESTTSIVSVGTLWALGISLLFLLKLGLVVGIQLFNRRAWVASPLYSWL